MSMNFVIGLVVGSFISFMIGLIWISESFSFKNIIFKLTFKEGDIVYNKSNEFSKDNWYKLVKVGKSMVQMELISSTNNGMVHSRTARKYELVGDYTYCPINRKELRTKSKFNKQLNNVLK